MGVRVAGAQEALAVAGVQLISMNGPRAFRSPMDTAQEVIAEVPGVTVVTGHLADKVPPEATAQVAVAGALAGQEVVALAVLEAMLTRPVVPNQQLPEQQIQEAARLLVEAAEAAVVVVNLPKSITAVRLEIMVAAVVVRVHLTTPLLAAPAELGSSRLSGFKKGNRSDKWYLRQGS